MTPEPHEFSTDPTRLDRARVHHLLSEHAYWARGRSRAAQDAAIDASHNCAMYDSAGELVAYARVVTDWVTMAWLCDVIVDPSRRGNGIGKALLASIMDDLGPRGIKRMILVTEDAHDLYRQYGFELVDDAWKWMVLR